MSPSFSFFLFEKTLINLILISMSMILDMIEWKRRIHVVYFNQSFEDPWLTPKVLGLRLCCCCCILISMRVISLCSFNYHPTLMPNFLEEYIQLQMHYCLRTFKLEGNVIISEKIFYIICCFILVILIVLSYLKKLHD